MRNGTNRALLNFMNFGEAKLSTFSSGVSNSITGNTSFPDSAALLAALNSAQTAYDKALLGALEGGRTQVAEKNASKVILLEALRRMCDMVNYVAQGDRVILTTSGFELSKEVASPVVLVPAKNVVVSYGDTSGQLDVAVQGVKNHKGLVFQYAVANGANTVGADNTWISKPSSTAKCTITNMPVGQKVFIRVGISGARKQVIYTDPVAKLVA